MSATHYPRFLSECISRVQDKQLVLRDDEMYGLYLSWCTLNAETPRSSMLLWKALEQEGLLHGDRSQGREWCGVSMTGAAAVDYIMSSRPSLQSL